MVTGQIAGDSDRSGEHRFTVDATDLGNTGRHAGRHPPERAVRRAVFLAAPDIAYAAVVGTTAAAIAVLSLPRGAVHERHGAWNRLIR